MFVNCMHSTIVFTGCDIVILPRNGYDKLIIFISGRQKDTLKWFL